MIPTAGDVDEIKVLTSQCFKGREYSARGRYEMTGQVVAMTLARQIWRQLHARTGARRDLNRAWTPSTARHCRPRARSAARGSADLGRPKLACVSAFVPKPALLLASLECCICDLLESFISGAER